MGKAKTRCVEFLSEIVWSYHTLFQSTTRETPFRLVYRSDVVLSIGLEIPSRKVGDFEEQKGRLFYLDTIDELRDKEKVKEVALKRRIEAEFLSKVSPREF